MPILSTNKQHATFYWLQCKICKKNLEAFLLIYPIHHHYGCKKITNSRSPWLPWFLAIAVISCHVVNIGVLYTISVFKRSLLSKFRSTFSFRLCTGYAHSHLINFAYILSYFIKFRILILQRGGVSCSHYYSCLRLWCRRLLSAFKGCK